MKPLWTMHTTLRSKMDDALSAETLDSLAHGGDEDALLIQQFEKDFEDMMQDIPDLQTALLSYQEARQRISERRRHRGFWPSKGREKVDVMPTKGSEKVANEAARTSFWRA